MAIIISLLKKMRFNFSLGKIIVFSIFTKHYWFKKNTKRINFGLFLMWKKKRIKKLLVSMLFYFTKKEIKKRKN